MNRRGTDVESRAVGKQPEAVQRPTRVIMWCAVSRLQKRYLEISRSAGFDHVSEDTQKFFRIRHVLDYVIADDEPKRAWGKRQMVPVADDIGPGLWRNVEVDHPLFVSAATSQIQHPPAIIASVGDQPRTHSSVTPSDERTELQHADQGVQQRTPPGVTSNLDIAARGAQMPDHDQGL